MPVPSQNMPGAFPGSMGQPQQTPNLAMGLSNEDKELSLLRDRVMDKVSVKEKDIT